MLKVSVFFTFGVNYWVNRYIRASHLSLAACSTWLRLEEGGTKMNFAGQKS